MEKSIVYHPEYKSVRNVKVSREMEARYMVFQEMLDMERREGREEGRAEGREEGRAEGRAEGREEGRILALLGLIQKKYKSGKPLNVIAEELGEPKEELAGYYRAVLAAPDKDPEELLELLNIPE